MDIDFGAALNDQQEPNRKAKTKRQKRVDAIAPLDPFDLASIRVRFAEYEAAVIRMAEQARAHEVTTEAEVREAVAMAGQAKNLAKKIDDQRKEIVDEPNRFVKAVNNFAKGFTDALGEIERILKKKIADYQYRQELARREAEKRAQEEARRLQEALDREAREKGIEPVCLPAPVLPEPERVTRTEDGTAYTRKVWTFEIVDPQAVPREYLCIDEQKIRQAVRMGVREIPGVRIFEETQINLRTA